jgi:hypothetical protein
MSTENVIKLDAHQTNFLTVAMAEALKAAKLKKEAEEEKEAKKGAKTSSSGKQSSS